MQGQVNLEFLGAAIIFLITIGTILTANIGIPQFSDDFKTASLNLEARKITSTMLSNSGFHDYGAGGTNWQKNNTTVENTISFGIARDNMEISRPKLERMKTATYDTEFSYFNYSQFIKVMNPRHQYQFQFIWLPIFESPASFTRCSPPIVDGKRIDEPVNCNDPDTYYENADNIVHYGEKYFNGENIQYLVTSHDGVYNTTYINKGNSWNFEFSSPRGVGDTLDIGGDRFNITRFQNRKKEPGSFFMLKKHLKTFGASIDSDSQVISLYRYVTMQGEPVRVKALAW